MVCEDSLVYEYLCRLKSALSRDVGDRIIGQGSGSLKD